ncbi:hypothetical protein DFP73DRAFT_595140 [Morchella snyderi]|nr:hypothetical protein DFP73DRAFT_595140 [Morchella snyderi]
METPVSQAGGRNAPTQLKCWLYSQPEIDTPWNGIDDPAHIHAPEPQHRPPIATYANAPVANESYSRAAKRKLELVKRVNIISSTLNPNLNEHHPSSTGTIHDHIPSRSAYTTNPSAHGAAGGATNAQNRRRQGSPAKKQRGNAIAKNPQRTGKKPAQSASDDERDEENDQGWRDPKGYPCTYYLAVAGTENDKEFQQGGKYHDCRLQGSNRVGYSSLQGVVETMKHTPHAILGRNQTCQPNAKTAQQQQRCRTWRDHYVKDHGPDLPMAAEIYVKFGAAMTAMTEAFACFVQRDERARALKEAFLESPEVKQVMADHEVMKQFKHPLYDDWDIGEVAWSVSWFPRDRRSNTSVPDTEAGHPIPSILECPRPGMPSNNNASAHPPPPPAADITPHPHQFSDSHQPSTHNHPYLAGWSFFPSPPPPPPREEPNSASDSSHLSRLSRTRGRSGGGLASGRNQPQRKSMLGPHGQATNARTYRQNSIDFASSDQQGRREASETGLPRGGEDSNPNRSANSFHTPSNDIAYPQAQLLEKLHGSSLAHYYENNPPLVKNYEEVPPQLDEDIGGELLRRMGAWVGDSVYLEGGQSPASSNRAYTNYSNYLHGTGPQTHEFNGGVAEPLPAGEADTHMIEIFPQKSVQLWDKLQESAGYDFN